jgi:DNA-binding NtrC family response regulator
MPPSYLISWIGRQDLEGCQQEPSAGPIVDFLRGHPTVTAVLLSDWPKDDESSYLSALRQAVTAAVRVRHTKLKDPTDYLGIFRAADHALAELVRETSVSEIAIHTSPGTSAMAAVWILLAKTKYAGATLFKSWLDKDGAPHLAEVEIPFDLTLDVLPDLAARRAALLAPSDAQLPTTNAFDALIHRSAAMAAVIRDARRAAVYPNPVLIFGESGTGKELLARAIHAASLRATKSWGAMNCGAIPRDLLDAELFGHAKGAFTGATADRAGRFEACDGGTLFLDEVGEMPQETQVRLLRVLQEGEIQRVGETKTREVDVRVVAATNRDLVAAVRAGAFRDDLFYRLAVLVLRLPPLRERPEDVLPLAQHFLAALNERAATIPGAERKHLSPGARKFAEGYPWPGNVRELQNTLARIFALVPGDTIRREDFQAQVIPTGGIGGPASPLSSRRNFSLRTELEAVERQLIEQALSETGGVKERAAKLLGLASRQALAHRIRALGITG